MPGRRAAASRNPMLVISAAGRAPAAAPRPQRPYVACGAYPVVGRSHSCQVLALLFTNGPGSVPGPDRWEMTSYSNATAISVDLVLGLSLYGTSFFMTAVQDGNNPLVGWYCAWVALWLPVESKDWLAQEGFSIRLWIAGLTNLFFLAYLLLRCLRKLPQARAWLVIATLVCIADTWQVLASGDLHIKLGHVAWVAGMLVILGPELARWNLLLERLRGARAGDADGSMRNPL